jgi:hypothetical protein
MTGRGLIVVVVCVGGLFWFFNSWWYACHFPRADQMGIIWAAQCLVRGYTTYREPTTPQPTSGHSAPINSPAQTDSPTPIDRMHLCNSWRATLDDRNRYGIPSSDADILAARSACQGVP